MESFAKRRLLIGKTWIADAAYSNVTMSIFHFDVGTDRSLLHERAICSKRS